MAKKTRKTAKPETRIVKLTVQIPHELSIKLSAVAESEFLGRGEYVAKLLAKDLSSTRFSRPGSKVDTDSQTSPSSPTSEK